MANGKGIAYAGLILGLIGAGLGGYVFYDNTLAPILGVSEPPSHYNSYYAEVYLATLSSTGISIPLAGVKVSFSTTETVSMHILYTSYVRITTATGNTVDVVIALNNTILSAGSYYIEEFGVAAQERFAINMQNYIPALPPGSYNVTVRAAVDDTLTNFYMNSLYVQIHT
jgi:hypothetical protein